MGVERRNCPTGGPSPPPSIHMSSPVFQGVVKHQYLSDVSEPSCLKFENFYGTKCKMLELVELNSWNGLPIQIHLRPSCNRSQKHHVEHTRYFLKQFLFCSQGHAFPFLKEKYVKCNGLFSQSFNSIQLQTFCAT